jgi:flagellar basal body rod protein FlgB
MNLTALVTDNISELLVKIIDFTKNRHKILMRNINDIDKPNLIPMDLPADEFSQSIEYALMEHVTNQRLVLCDSENVKFGFGGSFDAMPIVDEQAGYILQDSRDEYLEYQVNKLMENSLNQRLAKELVKQKLHIANEF